jgi:hypothetical protein
MVYRFLETLKTHEMGTSAQVHRLLRSTSTAAVSLIMRRPDTLDEIEREHLAAFRLAVPSLDTTYQLVQDFLVMMRKLEGERLDAWLAQVRESGLPELQSVSRGVERDKAAVQAGLTLTINNGQVEGQVTRIKLIKRMMYGKAGFPSCVNVFCTASKDHDVSETRGISCCLTKPSQLPILPGLTPRQMMHSFEGSVHMRKKASFS